MGDCPWPRFPEGLSYLGPLRDTADLFDVCSQPLGQHGMARSASPRMEGVSYVSRQRRWEALGTARGMTYLRQIDAQRCQSLVMQQSPGGYGKVRIAVGRGGGPQVLEHLLFHSRGAFLCIEALQSNESQRTRWTTRHAALTILQTNAGYLYQQKTSHVPDFPP